MGPRGPREVSSWVFAGGDPPDAAVLRDLPRADLVIAADSGLGHAQRLGVAVDLLVGDLDSVDADALEAAVAAGVDVEQHPTAKDATDLELALDAAVQRGARSALVVGGHGGRLDHLLANALLCASPRFATLRIEARMGDARVTVIHDRAEIDGAPGSLCSLLPVGGPADGVSTTGLRFPLHNETLEPGSTRGVSNEFLASTATVSLQGGVLLAVVPNVRKVS